MNIVLCGLQASGKSHFGKKIAEKVGWTFVDTDCLIESLYAGDTGSHKTCREIAKQHGDPYFRGYENRAIAGLSSNPQIVSIGGGALESQDNIRKLKTVGKLVYIQTDPEEVFKRMMQQSTLSTLLDSHDPRGSFDKLVKRRLTVYEEHCDEIVVTDGLQDEEVVERLCTIIKGKSNG